MLIEFVGRRLLQALPVLVLASVVVFSMLHLVPGDPIDAMMGSAAFQSGGGRQDLVDRIRLELGLNDPLPLQYGRWGLGPRQGDFARWLVRGRPVGRLVMEH